MYIFELGKWVSLFDGLINFKCAQVLKKSLKREFRYDVLKTLHPTI